MQLKQNELSLNVLVLLVHESDLLYLVGLKSKFAGSLFGSVKRPHLDRCLGKKNKTPLLCSSPSSKQKEFEV